MAIRSVGGTEAFLGPLAGMEDLTVKDFWRWSFGDLSDDDLKGYFAEWMVANILQLSNMRRRVPWANSDLISSGGARIEVKSTAFWQSWKLVNEDGSAKYADNYPPPVDRRRIGFGGLRAGDSVTASTTSASRVFKSHLYVFAF